MKGIFFTIAALFLMSASVYAKGEPSTQRGAPTGFADVKRITPIKVTYDDAEAEAKADEERSYVRAGKDGKLMLHREDENLISLHYYKLMGSEDPGAQRHNLNYGNNLILAPLQGRIH